MGFFVTLKRLWTWVRPIKVNSFEKFQEVLDQHGCRKVSITYLIRDVQEGQRVLQGARYIAYTIRNFKVEWEHIYVSRAETKPLDNPETRLMDPDVINNIRVVFDKLNEKYNSTSHTVDIYLIDHNGRVLDLG